MSRTLDEIANDIAEATNKLRLARERLNQLQAEHSAARLETSGLQGHVVSYTKSSWRSQSPIEVRFLVEGMSRWGGPQLRGRVIRKDGTLGTREVEASASVLTDHGVFEAAK